MNAYGISKTDLKQLNCENQGRYRHDSGPDEISKNRKSTHVPMTFIRLGIPVITVTLKVLIASVFKQNVITRDKNLMSDMILILTSKSTMRTKTIHRRKLNDIYCHFA